MKKIILLVICILGLTGCSDNEMEAPAYATEGYTEIISMDSIHLYRVGRNYEKDSYVLSKIVCSSREKVWEENVKLTDSVSVNIGYGDVITCYLQDISPFVESKELFMIEISYNPHNVTCYKIHSTENGSLLNSFQFTYPIMLYRGYVRWNNGDIIIPAIYDYGPVNYQGCGFLRINSKGEVTEDEIGGNGNLRGCFNPLIISSEEYIAYELGTDKVELCNLYKGYEENYPINIYLPKYLHKEYPEETNAPKVALKSIYFENGQLCFQVLATFFDGTTKDEEIIIDYAELTNK